MEPNHHFHPLATIFPLLGDAQIEALADDIKVHGLLEPIVLHEGKILDGRCRWLACERVGVPPSFRAYDGNDLLGSVISLNMHRRHLTKSQRVLAAARAATLPFGSNQMTPGLPIGRAAEVFSVSARNIARAKNILREGVPELVGAIECGKISLYRAAKVCELAQNVQAATLDQILQEKRYVRKKKEPAAVVSENYPSSEAAGRCERSPIADHYSRSNSELLKAKTANWGEEDGAAFAGRTSAGEAVKSACTKFVEELIEEEALLGLIAAWSRAETSARITFLNEIVEDDPNFASLMVRWSLASYATRMKLINELIERWSEWGIEG